MIIESVRVFILLFLGFFRLNNNAICAGSALFKYIDFHDYPDSTNPHPDHFTFHNCKRCNKLFAI